MVLRHWRLALLVAVLFLCVGWTLPQFTVTLFQVVRAWLVYRELEFSEAKNSVKCLMGLSWN